MLCGELYDPISDSGGKPILALPLSCVVGISMFKDIYEDIKRHISDRTENNKVSKVSKVFTKNKQQFKMFNSQKWNKIEVG